MSLLHQMFLQTLREVNAEPLAQQRAYQARLLRKVLDHAATTVTADQDRLALARLSPDPLAIWARIPILDLAHWSPATHTAHTLPAETQEVLHNRSKLALIAADTVFELGLERADVYLSCHMIDGTNRITALSHPGQWNSTMAGAKSYPMGTETPNKHHLYMTQQHIADLPPLTGEVNRVLINAFGLNTEQRTAIQRHTGVDPVCVWDSAPFGILGMETAPNQFRHELATHVIEIVDHADRPCPIGQTGAVVVTSLYDYATPMVRLRLPIQARATDPWTVAPAA